MTNCFNILSTTLANFITILASSITKISLFIKNFLNIEIPKPYSFVNSPLLCMVMPGIKCPVCAAKKPPVETWVLSGKHCPVCGHECKERAPERKPYNIKININERAPEQKPYNLMVKMLIFSLATILIFCLAYTLLTTYTNSVYKDYEILGEILENNTNDSEILIEVEDNSTEKTYFNEIASPLDQFINRDYVTLVIFILNNLRLSITNIGLYIGIATWLSISYNLITVNKFKVLINKWALSLETIYATVHSIVVNQIEKIKGQRYFPLVYSLFTFILASNLIGMIPYSFSTTSHFVLTFFLSFSLVLGSTFLGFNIHGFKFFSLFVPSGCPLGLLPLLVIIEFISYLSRNVSLGLRLGANILSGHMLLNILAGFTYNIMTSRFAFFFLGLIPLCFIIAFSGLELGIAFIQAQVFVVLTCSYIKDALFLH